MYIQWVDMRLTNPKIVFLHTHATLTQYCILAHTCDAYAVLHSCTHTCDAYAVLDAVSASAAFV